MPTLLFLQSVNLPLYRNRKKQKQTNKKKTKAKQEGIFTVKNLEMGRLYWIIQWTLNAITCILMRKRQRNIWYIERRYVKTEQRRIWRCQLWRLERCSYKPRKLTSTRGWKGRGMHYPLESVEGAGPCQYLNFSPGILKSDFWPPEL